MGYMLRLSGWCLEKDSPLSMSVVTLKDED